MPTEKERGVNMTKDMANQSRSDKGNIRFEVLTQNSRPNHMTVIEIWNNQQSITAHAASAAKKQYRETLTPMSGPKGAGLSLMIECLASLAVASPILAEYLEGSAASAKHWQNACVIALDIARAHGGELHLEDSPKGGLRAVVQIPV